MDAAFQIDVSLVDRCSDILVSISNDLFISPQQQLLDKYDLDDEICDAMFESFEDEDEDEEFFDSDDENETKQGKKKPAKKKKKTTRKSLTVCSAILCFGLN